VGYAPDRAELPDGITVCEWLDLISSAKHLPRMTREEFAAAEVADLTNRSLSTLSLGQLRRVLLAAAFMSNPPLLVLDEPSNGLDRSACEWLSEKIRKHLLTGGAALIATHDPIFAKNVATRQLTLSRGQLSERCT
jgi:ABC-type multidrug transport system ATPase subunit